MRIVAGKFRSRRITAPGNLPVRPTTDMAKEALFNILNNSYYFDDIKVLDLFAGIGSISFEFASRGTTDITAIDEHYGCVNFLEKTNSELEAGLQIIKSDVFSYLSRSAQSYDVIFADPPYDMEIEKFNQLLALVFDRKLLKAEGTLIVEHGKQTDLSVHPKFERSRKYGSNVFSFFTVE